MEMLKIKEKAKKRRAKLLAVKTKTGWTDTRLALKYKISVARIGQILKIARAEYITELLKK